jgi:hypothetical protein
LWFKGGGLILLEVADVDEQESWTLWSKPVALELSSKVRLDLALDRKFGPPSPLRLGNAPRFGIALHTSTSQRSYHRGNLPTALRAAARAILDEAGPDDIGLREVARRVGLSATAVHRHFTSKEDLLASVAADGFRELAAAIETGTTGSYPLGGVGLAYFNFALRKPGLFRLMFGPHFGRAGEIP